MIPVATHRTRSPPYREVAVVEESHGLVGFVSTNRCALPRYLFDEAYEPIERDAETQAALDEMADD